MDPKPTTTYFAPSTSGSSAIQCPSVRQPSLDERLVEPETREEMLRGQRLHVMPALPPHAERHFELDYVIRAHVATGYVGASDMLTRAGPGSDFATDTAVRRQGTDPATGTRYLEELAFEVVSTQSMREITMRAEDLSNRGVRRLLAIFVGRGQVCEWSNTEHRFVQLSLDGELEDPTLARPLPIRALLDAAQADNAVVDALDSKGNPRLLGIKAREFERGIERGIERSIEAACRALAIDLTPEHRTCLRGLDADGLERLLTRLTTERRWPGA
jgi:hypothetical protein